MYQGVLNIRDNLKFSQILPAHSFSKYFPTVSFFLIHPVVQFCSVNKKVKQILKYFQMSRKIKKR